MAQDSGFGRRRKVRWGLLALVVLLHIGAIFGLAAIFAPRFTSDAIEAVGSTLTVIVSTANEPEEQPAPEPDEGASGAAGDEAVPQPVSAPETPTPKPQPAPPVSSTGVENRSGASAGDGMGGADSGVGTGSGNSGSGQGGGIAVRPSVRSGELDDARDFPAPPGGRQERFGKSVTVAFIVTTDGRARNCAVLNTQVDADTTARVCPLVVDRIRFNPARDRDGNPVEARYGYRVDFRAR